MIDLNFEPGLNEQVQNERAIRFEEFACFAHMWDDPYEYTEGRARILVQREALRPSQIKTVRRYVDWLRSFDLDVRLGMCDLAELEVYEFWELNPVRVMSIPNASFMELQYLSTDSVQRVFVTLCIMRFLSTEYLKYGNNKVPYNIKPETVFRKLIANSARYGRGHIPIQGYERLESYLPREYDDKYGQMLYAFFNDKLRTMDQGRETMGTRVRTVPMSGITQEDWQTFINERIVR